MRNDKAIVKKGKPILLIAIAVIVLMGTLLAACGAKPEEAPVISTEPPVNLTEATAADEATLRELLLNESEMTITVTEDMEVDTQFVVKGTKVLTGDATIRMALSAEWYQSLLLVSDGSTLYMDGLVLDGNYIADGIHMEENANLVYLSGKIWRTDVYGIQASGNVNIQDVNIEKADYIGIYAQKGSVVTIEGGTWTDTATNDIYVDAGAAVDITGNATFSGCTGDSVINYGTVNVNDGTFSGAISYTFNNYGVLNIDYAGEAADGYVECSDSRLGIVCTRANAESNINRLHVTDTTRQAVVTVGGKTVITDSLFEKTGYHAIEIQAGEADIKNVTVKDAGDAGMEIYTKGIVNAENLTIDGTVGIGISSRGGTFTGNNLSISNTGKYGISCGNSTNGLTAGTASVSNIVITDAQRSGAYAYGGATMTLENAQITGSKSRGIYIAEDSKLTLSGESVVADNAYRGVEVRGTFTMESGSICRNYVYNSGAGVYVSPKGYFVMNGGTIYHNVSSVRGGGICVTEGKVTINNGNVYDNKAANNGGGLYAQKGAVVTLRSGSIRNNKSDAYGDGIYIVSDDTNVTMSGDFYLGNNDVKVDNVDTKLTITRDGLNWHYDTDPLLITPNYSAKEGTVVATCKSTAVAKAVAAVTKSGDGSYNIVQDGKNLVVEYATADMDMTGADTVEVSSFEQLKEAVESTTSKRYIVLKSDIVFPERLRLPGGATISIGDDGTQRTLTRADGYTDNLFVTHYGTGLILEATQQGNLVLDGTSSDPAATVQPLVRTAGSTVMRNVTLQNNGIVDGTEDVRGALFRQLYGDFEIYDSVLTGGSCNSGGAIMIDKGTGYIEGTTLSNNTSKIGGGAVRAAANTQLEIVNAHFDGNEAGSSGGAIVAVGGAKVTVTDTKFTNNTAKTSGGAILAQDTGTSVVLKGTSANAVISGNSSDKGGVFNVHSKGELTVDGYTVTENSATKGAVIYSSSPVTVTNTTFEKNVAKNEGGVIYAAAGGSITAEGCTFKQNTGSTGGGAVYVEAKATVTAKDSAFDANTSGANGNGGAVHTKGTYIDANSSYTNNSGKNGGAIAVLGGGSATVTGTDTNAVFSGNSATAKGSAVFINSGNCTGTVEGYIFAGNTGNGAFYVVATGSGTLKDATFNDGTANADGELTIDNVTGATLVQGSNAAGTSIGKIYIAGFEAGNQLTIKPYKYEGGHQVLLKADGTEESVFTAACEGIAVAKDAAGNVWSMEADGKLGDVAIAVIGSKTFSSLDAAIDYANTNGGTGDAADMTIELLSNIVMTQKLTVKKNVTIVNESGKNITISRDGAFTGAEMFQITGKLTLGTNDTAETGKLIVDAGTAARISKRAIANDAGATFVLARNAVLENAWNNQWGAALINKGTAHLYGTIRNNKCENGAGGAVLMHGDANSLTIYEGSYTGNIATRANDCFGGFLRVEAGSLEIRGGTFENNSASHHGGVVYVKAAKTVAITGGTFTNNTSGNGNAIYVSAGVAAALKDVAFPGQQIFAGGTVAVNNVSGTTLVQGEGGQIIAASVSATNQLTVIPAKYEAGHVVLTKADGMEDSAFAEACAAVTIPKDAAGNVWCLEADGKLGDIAIARIGDRNFSSLASAIEYANTNGGTGDAADVTIELLTNAAMTAKATINKNVAIVNESGKNITISRGSGYTKDVLFYVNAGAKLTLGTNNAAHTGKLTVDEMGITTTSRTVDNRGTFILARNASLENAKSNQWGTVLVNRGAAHLYGSIKNNECTGAGGAILQTSAGGSIIIHEGTYTGNTATRVASGSNTDGYGGVLRVQAGYKGVIEIKGGTFSGNSAVGRGGVLYWESGATVAITGGTFSNNGAKQGGAIYTLGSLNVSGATFSVNAATKGEGGAIYADTTAVVDAAGCSFTGNTSTAGGAAIFVAAGGSVNCENSVFAENNSTANGNGGAVHVKGTYIDTNSSYTNNYGKNGGAVIVQGGGNATITGTNEKAVMQNNSAAANGSAIFVNTNGKMTITGYTFTGETQQTIHVGGTVNYKDLTGHSFTGSKTPTEME